jgi:hypothetical protein
MNSDSAETFPIQDLKPSDLYSRHKHPLIHEERTGAWICDLCRTDYAIEVSSWRCPICDYDECGDCYNTHSGAPPALRHLHPLQPSYATFDCEACLASVGAAGVAYQCARCLRIECVNCRAPLQSTTPKAIKEPLHQHALSYCHAYANGIFFCDNCNTKFHNTKSFHCSSCTFDLCNKCFEYKTLGYGGGVGSHEHEWILQMPSWICNICSSQNVGGKMAYHCTKCKYNECETCYPNFSGSKAPEHCHTLAFTIPLYVHGYRCDLCSTLYPPGSHSHHCVICKYDECESCHLHAH